MTEKEQKEKETEEVVEETKVEETTTPDEKVEDTPEKEVKEDVEADEPKKEEEAETKEEGQEPTTEPDGEVKEEEPEENKPEEETPPEETVEEVKTETVEEPENKEDELEQLRKEVEELRTEKENQEEVKGFAKDVENIRKVFDDTCERLAGALQEEFKRYEIDTTKTIEEIAKEDPTKATIARNLVEQAEHIRSEQEANARKAIEDKYTNIIFNKADRILSKLDISDDEAPIVAQTFVDIVQRVGVTDLDGDLADKIRLSVANAKYIIGQQTGEVLQPVEEIEAAAADIVDDAVQEVVKEDEVKEETKEDVPTEPEVPVEPEHKEEVVEEVKPDLDELKQGADANGTGVNAGLTEDTVLDYMASLPTKERVKFYKENLALVTRASKKAFERGN